MSAARAHSRPNRRLERELGSPHFTRTSRRVALTSAGETFLPEARRVVEAARHALEVGRGHGGEVGVGYAEDLGPHLIQRAVARLGPSIRYGSSR